MGAVQTRLVQASLAKQTAKGTAATAPAYTIGLTGGKVYDVEISEAELDHTWDSRTVVAYDRDQAVPVSDLSVLALPKSIGHLLYLGLGGYAVVGATAPYTHTFTVADTLPYGTVWGKYGTGNSAQIIDAKVDSLELDWDKAGALKGKTKLIGCGFDPSVAFPAVGATGESANAGVLKGVGGTFTFDGATARVVGGNIKISNNLEVIVTSDAITPADVFEAKSAIEVQLKIKPTDLTSWRKIVTGSPTGTSVSKDPFYAPFDVKFTGPSGASLDLTAPRIAWSVTMPDATPAGGAAELTLTGRIVAPPTGSQFTATLVNSVATY